MTLLFAGHDTTTSTISFMFYELARQPAIAARLRGRAGRRCSGGRPSAGAAARRASCRELEMVLDETLRKYPPAWVGPRRARGGVRVRRRARCPARAFVNYCSWASHHLPDVFPEPEAFRPSASRREAKAALPKGAYVPFGGGSRTCIGMRFGQLEMRAIATLILARCTLSAPRRFTLTIRQMPTIGPATGCR